MDIWMQVNTGTSRSVYADASLSLSSITKSTKSPGSSASNATMNSWSSNPNEWTVLMRTDGYLRPMRTWSFIAAWRCSKGSAYQSRFFTNGYTNR